MAENVLGYYLIIDCGDGSAHMKLIKDRLTAEAYDDFEMETQERGTLSEGVEEITQKHFDQALTMEDFLAEVAEHNEYADTPYVIPERFLKAKAENAQ